MMDQTPIRLLFVEDSEIDVELALRAMKQEGFDVSWQRVDQESALRQSLTTSPPQMIFSDFSMPNFDGAGALRVAREIAPDIPFIFVSGTIGEERAIEAIRMGATDYVLKNNLKRLGTAARRALTESAEREAARKVEAERVRLVEVLEATSDFVGMSEPDGTIIYLNAAGRRMIGAPESGDVDKLMHDAQPDWGNWSNQSMTSAELPAAAKTGLWNGEGAILAADGNKIPVSQVMIAHRGSNGEIRFFSTIARDIRERKAYEARIEHFANYNPLTGMPNRNLLSDRAAQSFALARRNKGTVALLMLNVDRFKRINDSYGHNVGDELLCMVAERLQQAVRDGDTVAHMGSDSFAILATGFRQEHILALARQIQEAMKQPFLVAGHDLHATMTIGAGIYPKDGADFDTLFRNADSAMHNAVDREQGGFQFYASAMTYEAIYRIEMENELRLALERKELEIHYQPQLALTAGRMISVEALMRWNHKKLGWIPPSKFIPIAEDSDLIYPLGEFALNQACRQIRIWDYAGLPPLRVAVNVSARQFRSHGFLDAIDKALATASIKPNRLEIELTESVLVEAPDEVIAILKQLKAIGVQVAVDDFGTGYSSLSYLSRLPIDALKIDQSFVSRITKDGHDASIAQAIISLAHALGLRVIAEGIETTQQLAFLNSHHCDEGQGYLFSRPITADKIPPQINTKFPGSVRGTEA